MFKKRNAAVPHLAAYEFSCYELRACQVAHKFQAYFLEK